MLYSLFGIEGARGKGEGSPYIQYNFFFQRIFNDEIGLKFRFHKFPLIKKKD